MRINDSNDKSVILFTLHGGISFQAASSGLWRPNKLCYDIDTKWMNMHCYSIIQIKMHKNPSHTQNKNKSICWYVCLFLMNWFSMNIRSKNPNTIFETPYFRRQYTSYFKQSRISRHNYTDVLVISSDVLGKHEFSSPAFSFVIRVSSLWSMWFHQFAMQCYNWFCSRPWWRDQMETLSALLAICAVNSPVNGEFHVQRPVTLSLDDLFDLRLNKRLSKQWWGGCFETLSCPLWRHCNAMLVGIHSERDVLLLHFGILYD